MEGSAEIFRVGKGKGGVGWVDLVFHLSLTWYADRWDLPSVGLCGTEWWDAVCG